MLSRYRPLFASADSLRLVSTSLAARLAVGILVLPLLLVAEDSTGSYAAAGVVSGAWSAGIAVSSPLRGRLVDRLGSQRALPPLTVVSALALASVVPLAETGSVAALSGAALVSGLAMPPLVASMRLEWQGLLGPGHPHLAQAYAFESAAQVAMFVIGPLLAAAGVALAGPRATLLAACALMLAGGLAFSTQARVDPDPAAHGSSPIRLPGVRTLVIATVLADIALGVVDIAVVAFADLRGEPAAGGLLLAVFALGSVVGGLGFGARGWRGTSAAQLVAILVMSAVLLGLLAVPESIPVLAVLLLPAGAPSAAQWAATSLALDAASGGSAGAEAYTWLSSANGVGVGLGGVIAGALVEGPGTAAAFLAAAAAALLAAALVASRRRTLG